MSVRPVLCRWCLGGIWPAGGAWIWLLSGCPWLFGGKPGMAGGGMLSGCPGLVLVVPWMACPVCCVSCACLLLSSVLYSWRGDMICFFLLFVLFCVWLCCVTMVCGVLCNVASPRPSLLLLLSVSIIRVSWSCAICKIPPKWLMAHCMSRSSSSMAVISMVSWLSGFSASSCASLNPVAARRKL